MNIDLTGKRAVVCGGTSWSLSKEAVRLDTVLPRLTATTLV